MSNPTGKNQFNGGASAKGAHPKHSAPVAGPAAAKAPRKRNTVTVLHGTWQGPPNARVFVPSGKTSKVAGPSKYG